MKPEAQVSPNAAAGRGPLRLLSTFRQRAFGPPKTLAPDAKSSAVPQIVKSDSCKNRGGVARRATEAHRDS